MKYEIRSSCVWHHYESIMIDESIIMIIMYDMRLEMKVCKYD